MPQATDTVSTELTGVALEALRRHAGQVDKAGQPYLWHVLAVASRVARERPDDLVAQQAALLHDVVEDTFDIAFYGLDAGLEWVHLTVARDCGADPMEVVRVVDAVTRRDGESYNDFITRVIEAGASAVAVKLADVSDNLDRIESIPDDDDRYSLIRRYRLAQTRLIDAKRDLLVRGEW